MIDFKVKIVVVNGFKYVQIWDGEDYVCQASARRIVKLVKPEYLKKEDETKLIENEGFQTNIPEGNQDVSD